MVDTYINRDFMCSAIRLSVLGQLVPALWEERSEDLLTKQQRIPEDLSTQKRRCEHFKHRKCINCSR